MSNTPARIVVIEDNPADIVVLRYALDYHTNDYQLEDLLDGEAAIQFVEEQRKMTEPVPCVIVLDWHLPKHNGAEVLQAIKTEPVLAHVHVVALTTLAPKDEIDLHRLGVRLHARKPIDLENWCTLGGRILEICKEGIVQNRLREAYQSALVAWTKAGGTDSSKIHLESAKAAKTQLDKAATELVSHRQSHGC